MHLRTHSGERLEDLRLANLARVRELVQSALIHDLKGPLNAATLELDLLRQMLEYDDQTGPRGLTGPLESIRAIQRELHRLDAALPDLAPLRDATSDEQDRLDPCDVIRRAVRLTRQRAIVRNVRVELTCVEEPVAVVGASGPLLHATLNLLLNALEASPAGGTVHVECGREGGEVRVTIEDDGPGIGTEDNEQAFEPRFTRKPGHAGLGLTVARAILEQQQGRIRLGLRPGCGTVAEIALKVAEE